MVLLGNLCFGLFFIWGCQGNRPMGPARFATLSVSIPITKQISGTLLGASSDELLYQITGPNMSPVNGSLGPFPSATLSGSIDFSINVQTGPSRVLAIQLNDATTHQPLAIGAVGMDIGNQPLANSVVELGSVIRNCYFVNGSTFFSGNQGQFTYGFDSDNAVGGSTAGAGFDISVQQVTLGSTTGFCLVDASGNYSNSIAYMGGSDLVNYAYVPDQSNFSYYSYDSKQYVGSLAPPSASTGTAGNPTPQSTVIIIRGGVFTPDQTILQAGDVYCIETASIPGGHAWLQVTDPGTPGVSGPSFRFRVNKTLPYYAFDSTSIDISSLGVCNPNW